MLLIYDITPYDLLCQTFFENQLDGIYILLDTPKDCVRNFWNINTFVCYSVLKENSAGG